MNRVESGRTAQMILLLMALLLIAGCSVATKGATPNSAAAKGIQTPDALMDGNHPCAEEPTNEAFELCMKGFPTERAPQTPTTELTPSSTPEPNPTALLPVPTQTPTATESNFCLFHVNNSAELDLETVGLNETKDLGNGFTIKDGTITHGSHSLSVRCEGKNPRLSSQSIPPDACAFTTAPENPSVTFFVYGPEVDINTRNGAAVTSGSSSRQDIVVWGTNFAGMTKSSTAINVKTFAVSPPLVGCSYDPLGNQADFPRLDLPK